MPLEKTLFEEKQEEDRKRFKFELEFGETINQYLSENISEKELKDFVKKNKVLMGDCYPITDDPRGYVVREAVHACEEELSHERLNPVRDYLLKRKDCVHSVLIHQFFDDDYPEVVKAFNQYIETGESLSHLKSADLSLDDPLELLILSAVDYTESKGDSKSYIGCVNELMLGESTTSYVKKVNEVLVGKRSFMLYVVNATDGHTYTNLKIN
jgi:hypothetical protein